MQEWVVEDAAQGTQQARQQQAQQVRPRPEHARSGLLRSSSRSYPKTCIDKGFQDAASFPLSACQSCRQTRLHSKGHGSMGLVYIHLQAAVLWHLCTVSMPNSSFYTRQDFMADGVRSSGLMAPSWVRVTSVSLACAAFHLGFLLGRSQTVCFPASAASPRVHALLAVTRVINCSAHCTTRATGNVHPSYLCFAALLCLISRSGTMRICSEQSWCLIENNTTSQVLRAATPPKAGNTNESEALVIATRRKFNQSSRVCPFA